LEAELPDFYAPGDGKAIFCKDLEQPMSKDGVFRGPIAVRRVPGKGRGVVATRAVDAGELLATDPCFVLTGEDCDRLEATSLHGHYFAHPKSDDLGCLVFGPISLVNHAAEPSCRLDWVEDAELGWTVNLLADRPLAAGEELTIRYKAALWFEAVA
jgi:hypothetical protein